MHNQGHLLQNMKNSILFLNLGTIYCIDNHAIENCELTLVDHNFGTVRLVTLPVLDLGKSARVETKKYTCPSSNEGSYILGSYLPFRSFETV